MLMIRTMLYKQWTVYYLTHDLAYFNSLSSIWLCGLYKSNLALNRVKTLIVNAVISKPDG